MSGMKLTSTCVMSISCWKALGSPELVLSNTLMTAFDGRSFRLHGILPSFDIKLVGKIVSVKVEVVYVDFDYNLLLCRSWTYDMCVISLSFFRVLTFPHEGNIVIVD